MRGGYKMGWWWGWVRDAQSQFHSSSPGVPNLLVFSSLLAKFLFCLSLVPFSGLIVVLHGRD